MSLAHKRSWVLLDARPPPYHLISDQNGPPLTNNERSQKQSEEETTRQVKKKAVEMLAKHALLAIRVSRQSLP